MFRDLTMVEAMTLDYEAWQEGTSRVHREQEKAGLLAKLRAAFKR
jgi:hypothetical protein